MSPSLAVSEAGGCHVTLQCTDEAQAAEAGSVSGRKMPKMWCAWNHCQQKDRQYVKEWWEEWVYCEHVYGQHTCKLQPSLISLICLGTFSRAQLYLVLAKDSVTDTPRIIHLGQDFTSAVALQNWKMIVISKLCCYRILESMLLRLSVSSDVCKHSL